MQSSFLNFTSFKKAANRLLSRMESSSASCVVVQLGQGGNQLYTSFFTALANLSNPTMQNSGFFREGTKGGRVARAVLIDMEPKVHTFAV